VKKFFRKLLRFLFEQPITILTWHTKPGVVISAVLIFVFGLYLTLFNLISVFALNDTNNLWTFNTANAGSYTYDSNLVAIDTSAHPISGVNKFTNPAFASDASSWSVTAVNGSGTPTGWVAVPGNSTYSITDFLAMKYEAKNDGSNNAVSQASGTPYVSISQTSSITKCSAVTVAGSAAHLQTNNEWMTVARNAEAQASNWSLGTVGSGYLFAGHNDNAPAAAKAASSTDTGDNRCAYTDTAGTTEAPSSCPTNTANNTSGTAGNQVRVLTLSNGSAIWDIAGNVWEWTNDTITEANQPDVTGQSGFAWREFTALTSYGTLSYDLVRPAGTTYDATYGVGRIYHNSGSSASTVYAF